MNLTRHLAWTGEDAMGPYDELAISVMANWNDWRSAGARLCDLHDVHWYQPQGAPHPLIHAYLSCSAVTTGQLAHRCNADSAPHLIRVCVLRSHNVPLNYTELVRRAARAVPAVGSLHVSRYTSRVVPQESAAW